MIQNNLRVSTVFLQFVRYTKTPTHELSELLTFNAARARSKLQAETCYIPDVSYIQLHDDTYYQTIKTTYVRRTFFVARNYTRHVGNVIPGIHTKSSISQLLFLIFTNVCTPAVCSFASVQYLYCSTTVIAAGDTAVAVLFCSSSIYAYCWMSSSFAGGFRQTRGSATWFLQLFHRDSLVTATTTAAAFTADTTAATPTTTTTALVLIHSYRSKLRLVRHSSTLLPHISPSLQWQPFVCRRFRSHLCMCQTRSPLTYNFRYVSPHLVSHPAVTPWSGLLDHLLQ